MKALPKRCALWLAFLSPLALRAVDGVSAPRDYLDYSDYYRHVAVTYAGEVHSFAYSAPILFAGGRTLANDAAALYLFDLTDPARLVQLAVLPLSEYPSYSIEGILAEGATLFITTTDYGLITLDISSPTAPAILADLPIGYAGEMQKQGDLLVIAGGEPGFALVNVADPAMPILLGSLTTVSAQSAALRDTLLYVADGRGGMETISIADPTAPRRLHITQAWDRTLDVELFDDLAVIAQGNAGIKAIDISNPLDWQRLVSSSPTMPVGEFSRQGGRILTAAFDYYDTMMSVYDLSDPVAPQLLGQYPAPYAFEVTFAESLLVSAHWGVCIDRQQAPVPAPELGHVDLPSDLWYDVGLSGDLLYVAAEEGLHVINASEPALPQLLATLFPTERCLGIAIVDEIAYVAVSQSGLHVLDVSEPADVVEIGVASLPVNLGALALQGDLCAIVEHFDAVHLFDVARPSSPRRLATIAVQGEVNDLAFGAGGILALATTDVGMVLVDCSTPESPLVAGSYVRPWPDRGIAVVGDLAYVLNRVAGLLILDISDPWQPVLVGSAGIPCYGYDISVAGDYAFLACLNEGTQILDVSSPARPRYVGCLPAPDRYAFSVWAGPDWFCVDNIQRLTFGFLPSPDLTAVAEVETEAAEGFSVAAYPIPSNPDVTIMLAVRKAQSIRLVVYDVTGRECVALADRWFATGEHQIVWDGEHGSDGQAASGVYFVRAQGESEASTRRIVIVK